MRPHKYPAVVFEVLDLFLFRCKDGDKIHQRQYAETSAHRSDIHERHIWFCAEVDPVQTHHSEWDWEGKNGSDEFFVFFSVRFN